MRASGSRDGSVIVAGGSRHHSSVRHSSLSLALPEAGVARSREAGEARLAAIVTDHFEFVWRLLRRNGLTPEDADDATQQVFMTATQKLDRIRPGSERTFLYGTALRVAANARRSTRRRGFAQLLPETHPDRGAGPEARVELARAWALVDTLLAALPGELARVLALAEIEELEVKEIAELERIPVGTAASRLRRARERFQQELAARGPRNPFGGARDS